jgi:transposase
LNNAIPLKDKVIVLDNLSAHRNEKVIKKLKEFGVNLLFLPVATSFFNPIETIWAWIKLQWKKKLLDPIFKV